MSLYSLLGVSRDVDASELKRAWHAAAKALHPDRGGQLHLFQAAQAAYDRLSDPALRRQYDATLRANEGASARTVHRRSPDKSFPQRAAAPPRARFWRSPPERPAPGYTASPTSWHFSTSRPPPPSPPPPSPAAKPSPTRFRGTPRNPKSSASRRCDASDRNCPHCGGTCSDHCAYANVDPFRTRWNGDFGSRRYARWTGNEEHLSNAAAAAASPPHAPCSPHTTSRYSTTSPPNTTFTTNSPPYSSSPTHNAATPHTASLPRTTTQLHTASPHDASDQEFNLRRLRVRAQRRSERAVLTRWADNTRIVRQREATQRFQRASEGRRMRVLLSGWSDNTVMCTRHAQLVRDARERAVWCTWLQRHSEAKAKSRRVRRAGAAFLRREFRKLCGASAREKAKAVNEQAAIVQISNPISRLDAEFLAAHGRQPRAPPPPPSNDGVVQHWNQSNPEAYACMRATSCC